MLWKCVQSIRKKEHGQKWVGVHGSEIGHLPGANDVSKRFTYILLPAHIHTHNASFIHGIDGILRLKFGASKITIIDISLTVKRDSPPKIN